MIAKLPPFWTAAIFVCVIGMPQAFLALPIAAAPFGAVGGVVVVGFFGLLNMLTVAAVAGATATRERPEDPPQMLAGRVRSALGGTAEGLVIAGQTTTFFLALVASALGLSLTLDAETVIPASMWLAVLTAIVLVLVSRAALGLNVLMLLGGANIVLIALIGIAIATDGRARTIVGPRGGWSGPSAEEWATILGVTMVAYFGHALVGQAARQSVGRDVDGRALVRGSVAGMAMLTGMLCLWVFAVDSDLWPSDLDGQRGTVLIALDRVHGPWVAAFGTILTVTLSGLTAIRCATLLAGITRERLPRATAADRNPVGTWMVANALAIIALGLVGVMLITGAGSFTSVLGVAGVLGVAIFGGVMPPILLLAVLRSHRTSSSVARVLGPIRERSVALAVAAAFVAIIIIHPTLLWANPDVRVVGFVVALIVLAVAGTCVRQILATASVSAPTERASTATRG